MRLAIVFSLVLAACAGAPSRPSTATDDLAELKAQIAAQSSLVAQQQRRIEELEIKLAAMQLRAQPPAQKAAPSSSTSAQPSHPEPRPHLKTVKLGGRRPNPVERAPRLPASVELKEPDVDALARLDAAVNDVAMDQDAGADLEWAAAVRKLNEGDHAHAETDFLAFAAGHPGHTAADNALYLAGLVREVRGDCEGAIPLFQSVPKRYPAGDAVTMAQLELGRCERVVGRRAEAKNTLTRLVTEHGDAPEAAQAQQLLLGL